MLRISGPATASRRASTTLSRSCQSSSSVRVAPSNKGSLFLKTGLGLLLTFACRSLAEQFSKYANVFFLFIAAIQQIPNVSPTNRFTTILPLGIVLLVAALKEIKEDVVRPAFVVSKEACPPFVRVGG